MTGNLARAWPMLPIFGTALPFTDVSKFLLSHLPFQELLLLVEKEDRGKSREGPGKLMPRLWPAKPGRAMALEAEQGSATCPSQKKGMMVEYPRML